MKVTTATALRANVVLFSVSICLAAIPCVSVALVFGLLDGGMPALPYQASIFLIAVLIMLLLRLHARRAFDSAVEAHKVQLTEGPPPEASIANDCRSAWMVQLHLELHGHHCID